MATEGVRQIRQQVASADHENLSKARLILEYTHESAQALLQAFDDLRKARGEADEEATDQEQDLLRAMLVFAAAGLDSMVKQLVRDVLPPLIELDEKVRQGLETFTVRQLRGEEGSLINQASNKFLARIIIAESHQKQVIKEYVSDLTDRSMQSPEEVMRAAYAFGLDPATLGVHPAKLKPIFDIRNKIIHELDINFGASPRHRQQRDRAEMLKHTNTLLETCESIFLGVADKLETGAEAA